MTSPRFSQRTAWDTTETRWARLLKERREAGRPVLDLTASNPTTCGISYDREWILSALRDPGVLEYNPDPKGLLTARKAVAGYYADHGVEIDVDQLILTTGTSEAYSFLFRLLCDPSDEVLIAQPSYPLFDFLADLDDVRLIAYPLFYDHGWSLDPEALRQRITPRTRAVVVVHPNNPTGHYTKAAERKVLEELCSEYGLALIVDEVFLDYPLGQIEPERSFAAGGHSALTFVLSGLSKVAALPQMKAGWIACFGPERELSEAVERLEVIGDTFLSVSAPGQYATPVWLAGRKGVQEQIQARTRSNLHSLDEAIAGQSLVSRLSVEAGWYAVLRIPARITDEEMAIELLENYGAAVQGGDFFGFGRSGWLVVSLLGREDEFRQGIGSIMKFFHGE